MKTTIIAATIVISFLFFAIPEKALSQVVPFDGCCQFINSCENLSQDACIADSTSIEFFINTECETGSRTCPGFNLDDSEVRPIPTISKWGMIATAGVLGLAGLYTVRKRKAAAYNIAKTLS